MQTERKCMIVVVNDVMHIVFHAEDYKWLLQNAGGSAYLDVSVQNFRARYSLKGFSEAYERIRSECQEQ